MAIFNSYVKLPEGKRPFGKISATSLYAMSLYKISIRGLLERQKKRDLSISEIKKQDLCQGPQSKVSVQAPYKRSLSKIAALFTRSLYKISIRGLLTRSLYKIPIRALSAQISLKRSLGKTSGQDIYKIL